MTVELGDGLTGLRGLEPGSVGLVLSDLPSGQTRAAFDVKLRDPGYSVFWARAWMCLKHYVNCQATLVEPECHG